jgi:hypothetical protein
MEVNVSFSIAISLVEGNQQQYHSKGKTHDLTRRRNHGLTMTNCRSWT